MVARHYTRRSLAALLEPWFENVETDVMGQRGEAIPLPASLRRPVERVVPSHLREQIVRRFGWFLFARATRTG